MQLEFHMLLHTVTSRCTSHKYLAQTHKYCSALKILKSWHNCGSCS